jgi:hypothetical protein
VKTVHGLDRAATIIGSDYPSWDKILATIVDDDDNDDDRERERYEKCSEGAGKK